MRKSQAKILDTIKILEHACNLEQPAAEQEIKKALKILRKLFREA